MKHTLGHVECPACARAQLVLYRALSGDLLFSAAFDIWISHRTLEAEGLRIEGVEYISRKTERDYRVCAKALGKYFHKLRLDQIDEARLSAYQQLRATNPVDQVNGNWYCWRGGVLAGHRKAADNEGGWRDDFDTLEAAEDWARNHGGGCEFVQTVWARRASAGCIRKEIALLQRILRDAALWTEERSKRFLKIKSSEPDVERALSRAEQHRLLHVASGPAKHRFIYQYTLVALQTTAGPNELRQLRLGDLVLEGREPYIQIPRAGAKNKYRKRIIPLITEDAVWAMEGLVGRARERGAWSPSHYLFPLQLSRTHYDPNRPMSESGLKKPFDALRKEAQMPELRIYDLRHTGITRMAEAGVPLPVAMSFAGHMTEQMQRRYTAICMAAQRQWGSAVWGAPTRPSGEETAQIRAAFDVPRKPVAAVGIPTRGVRHA
ncbi:tyrosine-type recombinase/integrase [Occallatibacter riparius]|uniref:Tyrosine-type recombinase/integrase n=1 Tax=Occallatibacter riparius TaxID=1002689 RepID=A0A9J7BPI1_9BACT|nr:tyrosine-type recombinase/integrase [Occallatibacter riparius]UWZ84667.1 tyrosine-type recombinase/integrase [Occallatibacter riparius]